MTCHRLSKPDEQDEFPDLGPPPSVGFTSAFLYDFDPTNGIDSNKQDFNATALHEIGHALGFVSHAGLKELIPSQPVIITTWDLLRFRPEWRERGHNTSRPPPASFKHACTLPHP